jgi:hypothetical protein
MNLGIGPREEWVGGEFDFTSWWVLGFENCWDCVPSVFVDVSVCADVTFIRRVPVCVRNVCVCVFVCVRAPLISDMPVQNSTTQFVKYKIRLCRRADISEIVLAINFHWMDYSACSGFPYFMIRDCHMLLLQKALLHCEFCTTSRLIPSLVRSSFVRTYFCVFRWVVLSVLLRQLSHGKWHRKLILVKCVPSLGALCVTAVWGWRLGVLSDDLVSANFCVLSSWFACRYCEETFP